MESTLTTTVKEPSLKALILFFEKENVCIMREKIYQIIEKSDGQSLLSNIYDYIMMAAIVLSIIPLASKQDYFLFHVTDAVTVLIFIIDYLLRLITADFKYGKHSLSSFIRYPFSFFAIIDLVGILPVVTELNTGFKLLKILRMSKSVRVFRIFKTFRYSKSFYRISRVMKNSKEPLIAVGILAAGYILISALVIFNVEPETFNSFFDAVYWATVSLTTVGYGDIYPVSTIGRIVTIISSIFGIAVVALPAGIITAGYMKEIEEKKEE